MATGVTKKQRQRAALDRAIAAFPTLKAFAAALSVSYQTVQSWRRNQVPFRYCVRIEKLVRGAVKRDELNEDWYALMRGE